MSSIDFFIFISDKIPTSVAKNGSREDAIIKPTWGEAKNEEMVLYCTVIISQLRQKYAQVGLHFGFYHDNFKAPVGLHLISVKPAASSRRPAGGGGHPAGAAGGGAAATRHNKNKTHFILIDVCIWRGGGSAQFKGRRPNTGPMPPAQARAASAPTLKQEQR
jgi:hypothetical protein